MESSPSPPRPPQPATQHLAIWAAGLVVLTVILGLPLLRIGFGQRGSIGGTICAAVMWALALGMAWRSLWRAHRRAKRLELGLRLATDRDGLVCPHCLGTPGVGAGHRRCCRRAPVDWTAETYRTWWTSMGENEATRPHLPWPGDEAATAGLRAWVPRSMTLMLLGMALSSLSNNPLPRDGLSWATAILPQFCLGYGLDILACGVRLGRLEHRTCARCGYLRSSGRPSGRCPECGRDWNRPGGTLVGQRVVRRELLVGGGSIVTIGLLLLFSQMATPVQSWLRSWQPTAGLIAAAAANGPGTFQQSDVAWAELARRTLSPAEEGALFDALLDARQEVAFMSIAAKGWAQGYIARGLLSPRQIHRWRVESFDVRLDAPASARSGQPFTVRVVGRQHEELLPPAFGVSVHVGGAWDDHGSQLVGPGGRGHWSLEIHQGKDQPSFDLSLNSVGRPELVVRVWLVARGYGNLQDPLEWQPDGTPILPPDALWAEPVELRHTIRITP